MRQGVMRDYSSTISVLTRIFDVGLVAAAGLAAHTLRFNGHGHFVTSQYATIILIGCLLTALLFPTMGLYQSWRAQGLLAPIGRVLSGTFVLFFLLLALLAMVHQANVFSRLWFGYWAICTAFSMIAIRIAMYWTLHTLRARGYNRRNVVIIGSGPKAHELIRKSTNNAWSGYRVTAAFSDTAQEFQPCIPTVLPLDTLAAFVNEQHVDEVWIALPLEQTTELRTVLNTLRTSSANVRYAPDLLGLYLLNHGVSNLFETPMIDLTASPIQGANRLVKAIEDKVLAALILIIMSPLMLLLALGVKLSSPGPILYRQERLGWNGRPFTMLKFRSMPTNAEIQSGPVWNRRESQRATPFGAFLRRTSLDELPQFINVLKGDMSIVGPRPERAVFVEQFKREIPGYMQKHMVKAGITGWAQINGWRGDSDLTKRIEHDLYYIENWSPWFDLKIIALTLVRGFAHQNAR